MSFPIVHLANKGCNEEAPSLAIGYVPFVVFMLALLLTYHLTVADELGGLVWSHYSTWETS